MPACLPEIPAVNIVDVALRSMKRLASILLLLVVALAITPGEWLHSHAEHDHDHATGHSHDHDSEEKECSICEFELVPVVLSESVNVFMLVRFAPELIAEAVQPVSEGCLFSGSVRGPPIG